MNNNQLVKKEEFRWSFLKKGKQVFNICTRLLFLMGLGVSSLLVSTPAKANPVGGTFTSGSGTITNTSPTTTTINQTTENGIVSWKSFDIAKGETTQVNQPNAQATEIEQIFTSGQLTAINGSLNSNGRVVVMNPNGVLIGASGNVDTAGFIATSAAGVDAIDPNTAISKLNFNTAGNAGASVINQGNINVADTGLVALVAPSVRNDGVITGNLSKVQLGAADTFGVDFYGDGLINLAVGPNTTKLNATNTGSITATGGKVLLTAAAASNVVDSVINNSGVIEANALENVNGQIVLKAPGAATNVSGTLQAKGGSIETSGETLNVAGGTDVEAANWLLDPTNIEISHATTAGTSNSSYTSNVTDATINKALQNNSTVTIQTQSSGTQEGDITLDSTAAINLTGGNTSTLVLDAATNTTAGQVFLNGTITSTGTNTLSLTVKAAGNITSSNDITLDGNGGTSTLSLTSANGSITTDNITVANVDNSAPQPNSQASVTIQAENNVSTGNVTVTSYDTNQPNFDSTSALSITSTSGSVTTNKIDVEAYQSKTSTDGSGSYSPATASLSVNSAGTFTVTTGGIKVASTALNTDTNFSTDSTSTLNVAAGGTIEITGAVTSTSTVTPPTYSSSSKNTSQTTAEANIASTGGELYFTSTPTVTAVNNGIPAAGTVHGGTTSSGPTLAVSDAYNGTNFNTTQLETISGATHNDNSYLTSSGVSTTCNATHCASTNVSVAGLTLTGIHTLSVTENASKTYGTSDSPTELNGLMVADIVYDNPLTDPSQTNPTLTAYTGTLSPTGFTRVTSVTSSAQEQVGSYAINLTGLPTIITSADTNKDQYAVTSGSSKLTINPASLTIQATGATKTYDGSNSSTATATQTGLVNATIDGVALNDTLTTTETFDTADAGARTLSVSSYTLSDPGNYTVTTKTAAGTITPKTLTATIINDPTKTYDGTTTATLNSSDYALNGFVGTQGATVTQTAGTYNSANVVGATSVSASLPAADFTANAGTTLSNYTLPTTASGPGSISAKELDIAAVSTGKLYGATDPALTYNQTGLVAGDSITGSLTRDAGEAVGTYGINQGSVTASSNYHIVYTAGTFTISQAVIDILATSGQSKVYGTNDPTLGYTETSGPTVTLTGSLGRAAGENVGLYAINQGTLLAPTGYTIVFTSANFNISPATLNIIAKASQSKVYGTNDPTLAYTQTGLINGIVDGVAINDTITGSLSRADYGTLAGEQVGLHTITQGSVTASSNYTIVYTPADFNITPAALNITADSSQTKVYGTNDPTLTYSETGLVTNTTVDGVTLNDSLSGSLSRADYGTLAGEQVGPHTITQGSVAVNNAADYTTTFNGADFNITPAALALTASGETKTYGINDPQLNGTQAGLVINTTVDGVTLNDKIIGDLTRDTGENVGTYNITQGTIAASDPTNYTTTFKGATLTITQAELDIAANATGKVYGAADPALTYTQKGLVNGVTVDGVTINDAISGNLSRDAGENVGTYTINQNTVTANSNYHIVYTPADFTISQATLDIIANAGQSKVYGTNDPTLTYSENGLVNGDTITGSLSRDQYGSVAGEQVGSYAINLGNLSAGSNYNIVLTNNANLTITAAPLTITANAGQSKTYGTNDPTLTYTQNGLVNATVDGVAINDTNSLTGSLSRADFGTSAGEQVVGTHAITQGSLDAGSNYAITFVGSNFTINPAQLALQSNNASKVYGVNDDLKNVGGTETGLVTGVTVDGVAINDGITGTLGRPDAGTLAGEQVGTHAITQGTIAATDPSNYTTTFHGSTLTITPASLTISAVSDTKVYDGTTTSTLSPVATGLVTTVDGLTITDSVTATQAFASKNVLGLNGSMLNVTGYTVNDGSNGADYTVTSTPSASGTITPAPLTATITAGSSTYGDPLNPGAANLSGVIGKDQVTVGAVTVANVNPSTSGHLRVGSYTGIESVGSTLSGADAGNYTFAGATGDYTVNKLNLSGTVADVTTTYGTPAATGAVSLATVITGDHVTAEAATIQGATYSTSNNLNHGTYTEASTTISGADAANYNFTGATGTYTVNKLDLSGTVADVTTTYGTPAATGAVNLTTVITGDKVTADPATVQNAAYSTSNNLNANTYTEASNGISGADAGNYNFTGATGTYTVNPLDLTGNITTGSATYGDQVLNPGQVKLTNVVPGDKVTVDQVVVDPTLDPNYDPNSSVSGSGNFNAGSYTAVQYINSISGKDAANYTYGNVTGDYTISKLNLSGSVANVTTTYGTPAATGAVNLTTVITGDDVTASAATIQGAIYSTSNNLNHGIYTESSTTISGADAANYNFTGATGTYTVNQKALGGFVTFGSSTYGDALNPGTVFLSGVVTGDNVTAGAATVNTTASNLSTSGHVNAGFYTETASSISGADAANYSFSGATGFYIVDTKALELNATAANKVYDGTTNDPGSSLTIASGVVGTDKVDVSYSPKPAQFSDPNIGTNKTVTFSNISLNGTDSGNYRVDVPGASGNISFSQGEEEGGVYTATATANITPDNAPNTTIDPLGRPIISVGDKEINFYPPFQPRETNGVDNVNVSIKGNSANASGGQNAGASNLANIEPAAGGDDDDATTKKKGKSKKTANSTSPKGLANVEPAAGGNDKAPQAKGNFACADDFLDGKNCTAQ